MKLFSRINWGTLQLALLLFVFSYTGYTQCNSTTRCKYNVTDNSVTSYSVNKNEVLCVAPGVDYTGTILLNGGIICNNGAIHNVTFVEGILNNYGDYIANSNVVVQNTGDVTINGFGRSKFTINGGLTLQSSSTNNVFWVNLSEGPASFVVLNNFDCTQGIFKLKISTVTNSFSESVTAVVGGQLNVGKNSGLNIECLPGATFNVNSAVSLDGKSPKLILNSGKINFNNNFNITGNGMGEGSVVIENTGGYFNIGQYFNTSFNNGIIMINSDETSTITIGKSWTQTKDNATMTNKGTVIINNDLNLDKGKVFNSGSFNVNNLNLKQGEFTNSSFLNVANDLSTTSGQATLSNDYHISVGGTLTNNGIINLDIASLMEVNNYINNGTGSIIGPDVVSDYASYGRIFISGASTNSGIVSQYVMIYDKTLQATTSNVGYGFDVVNTPSNIRPTVIFLTIVQISPGGPIVIPFCNIITSSYLLVSNANPATPVLPGSPVTLSAQFIGVNCLGPCPAINPQPVFTWQPMNINGPTTVVNPQTTTTYTVTTSYAGCSFSSVVTANVVTLTYAVLKKELDGGFFDVTSTRNPNALGQLNFLFEEEYVGNGVNLDCKIIKMNRTVINVPNQNVVYKENRYSIILAPLLSPAPLNSFYILEVTDKKGEKNYLRFKF